MRRAASLSFSLREPHSESTSSMKMMEGLCCLASSKRFFTSLDTKARGGCPHPEPQARTHSPTAHPLQRGTSPTHHCFLLPLPTPEPCAGTKEGNAVHREQPPPGQPSLGQPAALVTPYFSLSPSHFDIRSEDDTEKKVELLASVATALAK